MPRGYALPIEVRKEIRLLHSQGLCPKEIATKLKISESAAEKYSYTKGDLTPKPMPKISGSVKQMATRTIIAVEKARRHFDSVQQGARVKVLYKERKGTHGSLMDNDSTKVHNGIVIHKTANIITVSEIGQEYKRMGIGIADILAEGIRFEVMV